MDRLSVARRLTHCLLSLFQQGTVSIGRGVFCSLPVACRSGSTPCTGSDIFAGIERHTLSVQQLSFLRERLTEPMD